MTHGGSSILRNLQRMGSVKSRLKSAANLTGADAQVRGMTTTSRTHTHMTHTQQREAQRVACVPARYQSGGGGMFLALRRAVLTSLMMCRV